jgi:VanZ family protein
MAVKRNKPAVIFAKFWLPLFAWMGLIFYSSSLPAKDLPELFPFQDILYHLLTYAILTFLFSRAISSLADNLKNEDCFAPRGFAMTVVFLATAFGFLYGLSDEVHQFFVPGRSCSAADLLVDSMGSFLGSLIQQWQR